MKFIYIIVEGKSEENFIKYVLAPYFQEKNIFLTPEVVITGKNRSGKLCKGGGDSYMLYKDHISKRANDFFEMKEYYFSTMIDLYALSEDFPGYSEISNIRDKYELVEHLENEFKNDIGIKNFIPYIQLHEFESLLLYDIDKIAEEFLDINVNIKKFKKEVSGYSSLELVNSSKETAPSKRINKYTKGQYCTRKVASSSNILKNIDINHLRNNYKHFDDWLKSIEMI